MSDWKVIVPSPVDNMVLNPSAEDQWSNFACVGGVGCVGSSTTYARYGLYSYHLVTAVNDLGMSLSLSSLANAIHYVTLRARGTWGASWDWSLNNVNYTAPTLLRTDGSWRTYGLQFPAAQAIGSILLYIRQNGAGNLDLYIDGVQVEQDTTYTTYCDGDQKGCEWNGAAHGSMSTRSAVSRAGGDIYDFHDDYHMGIREHIGSGMVPQILSLDSYSILPGGELNAVKVQPRPFTLVGVLKGYGSDCDLHQTRQDLVDILAHDAYPRDDDGWQPVLIRYQGADIQKEIAAHYESGLEATIRLENRIHEIAPVRFIAPDPRWYEVGESSAILTSTGSTLTTRFIAGRLRSLGIWHYLNIAAPAGGTTINAIAIAQNNDVFIGGDFTDFDTDLDADRIARWEDRGAQWTWPTNEMVDNGAVYALLFGPDDTLYVGGSFTSVSVGQANTNKIASWDYTTGAWTAMGNSVTGMGDVQCFAFGKDGNLYIGGSYTQIGGGGGPAYICYWDGAYNAMGAGTNGTVGAVACGLDGTVYVGGAFTTAGGVAHLRIAKWDATNGWQSMGDANNTVQALAVDPNDGTLYVAGDFTQIGGQSISYIAKWNGTTYEPVGSLNNAVNWHCLGVAPDGMVYAGGDFTEADGTTVDKIAKWNGGSWVPLDADFPGSPFDPQAIAFGPQDPVIPTNYDVFVGYANTGVVTRAGSTTVTNDGTAPARPKIIIRNPTATTPTVTQIRNETTGKEISFDYVMRPYETLTVDLTPTDMNVTSDYYGQRNDAILAGSDVGEFTLMPGSNQITALIGSAIADFALLWRDTYKSFD